MDDTEERVVTSIDDFDELLRLLFARKRQRDAQFVEGFRAGRSIEGIPSTEVDHLRAIWEEVLPHRKLEFGDGKVIARPSGGDFDENRYSAADLSDGERVAFYLAGQCLCAPDNALLIIDEPELHLHRSIRDRLWNEIEKKRPDCTFLYLTHDVDFAARRVGAKKIWMKGYDGGGWDWEEVEPLNGVPEELRLEVLGSREQVLFVEGDTDSYDATLYDAVYPDVTIMPLGSCETVIRTVRGFTEVENLHHAHPKGLIDRDYRAERELRSRKESGVHTLDVAEVENLFCLPGILREIAKRLSHDPEEKLDEAKELIFEELERAREQQIARRAEREVKFRLETADLSGASNATDLRSSFEEEIDQIDVGKIYDEAERAVQRVIEERDYVGALRVFNRKGLASQLEQVFEVKVADFVQRTIQQGEGEEFLEVLREFLPTQEALVRGLVKPSSGR